MGNGDELLLALTRRVKTPEGSRKYRKPIGALLGGGSSGEASRLVRRMGAQKPNHASSHPFTEGQDPRKVESHLRRAKVGTHLTTYQGKVFQKIGPNHWTQTHEGGRPINRSASSKVYDSSFLYTLHVGDDYDMGWNHAATKLTEPSARDIEIARRHHKATDKHRFHKAIKQMAKEARESPKSQFDVGSPLMGIL
jgi:hypothetical protein